MTRVAALFSLFLLSAGSAGAAGWEIFERHCLLPQEAGEMALPLDVKAVAHYKNDGDTYTDFAFDRRTVILSVSDRDGDEPKWCRVVVSADAAGFEDSFNVWLQTAQDAGRYDRATAEDGDAVFISTDWRTPRIEISFGPDPAGAGVRLSVKEMTDA